MNNGRFMRLIIMYDLNIDTKEEVQEYNKFRKFLISRGYVMMQYSIYMKTLNAKTKENYEVEAIKKYIPKNGNIRVLSITDNQYHSMKMLRGGKMINETINGEQRRVYIKDEYDWE